ncbi:MAG: vWA domain-containing protein [bacterium]
MSWTRVVASMLLALVMLAPTSCTDAKLERIPSPPNYRDDKLQISGGFCTRTPESLVFPLRVMFIVDSSVSMEANDPPDPVTGLTGRERAVADTWTNLLDQGAEGIKFSVIRFSAQAQPQTGIDLDGDSLPDTYFTADRQLLDVATASLGQTDRTTNYLNALGEAYFEIRTELAAADKESLPLSKYVVVFLSDGEPDTDNGGERENSREEILDAVNQIRELTKNFRVGTFEFNTAFISSGQAAADNGAKELLKAMADVGSGNFRSFPSGEELNFLYIDFTVLRRVFTLRSFGVFNQNMVMDLNQIPPPAPPQLADAGMDAGDMGSDAGSADAGTPDAGYALAPNIPASMYVDSDGSGALNCGEPMADTDADGLSDVQEIMMRSNPLVRDTDDDGLNDYLEWSFRDDGLNLLDRTDSRCFIPSPCVDQDMDGFCDCVVDADADGVCDCTTDTEEPCLDAAGHDCLDEDMDGLCDCPDRDGDGRCDYDDRDGDGLHDCEEVFYGTAQNGNDTDADGLPDAIEVRFQTNPAEDDSLVDLDADQTLNGVEILANTNPICEDTTFRTRNAYRYTLRDLGLKGASTCYDFDVTNITLVPTIETPEATYPGNGWNRIYIFAGEVAFDDPNAFALYRIACVYASYNPDGNYKNPPSGRIALKESDFVEVSEFDPEIHCRFP